MIYEKNIVKMQNARGKNSTQSRHIYDRKGEQYGKKNCDIIQKTGGLNTQ
jgi:hypothetical protein